MACAGWPESADSAKGRLQRLVATVEARIRIRCKGQKQLAARA